jgi:hypothetical protein
MIPIDEWLLPKFIKDRTLKRIVLTIAGFAIIIGIGYCSMIKFQREISQGRDFSGLRLEITHRLLDSVAIGLERYRNIKGHYPETSGKYFLDSIKHFIGSLDYVYVDSVLQSGDTVIMGWGTFQNIDYLTSSHTYFGFKLIYQVTESSYLLYSVGENEKDENGEGDDILFHRKQWYEFWK